MLKQQMRACIHGAVHGVGFRATTKRYAEQLHLTGFVRNVSDGSVEICAQGDKQTIEKLLELLRQTFGTSCIRQIDVTFQAVEVFYRDFIIML